MKQALLAFAIMVGATTMAVSPSVAGGVMLHPQCEYGRGALDFDEAATCEKTMADHDRFVAEQAMEQRRQAAAEAALNALVQQCGQNNANACNAVAQIVGPVGKK